MGIHVDPLGLVTNRLELLLHFEVEAGEADLTELIFTLEILFVVIVVKEEEYLVLPALVEDLIYVAIVAFLYLALHWIGHIEVAMTLEDMFLGVWLPECNDCHFSCLLHIAFLGFLQVCEA